MRTSKCNKKASRRRFLGGLATAVLGATLPFVRSAAAFATKGLFSLRQGLATRIKGPIIARGETNYEEWRRSMVWQMRKPNRYPELIVRPTSVNEVSEAIGYARRAGLKIAAKSGGHHQWANFLRDEGMLLDMWNFRGLAVDPERGTAPVGPSLWGYQFDHELARHGYAFPVARAPTVPLGGYLLGGGIGINWDNWGGPSCFSVLGAEVVTADGNLLSVSPERHRDLYWALRGGGNGFPGVVTRFNLKLYPRPGFIATSTYSFPASYLEEVADWVVELAEGGLQKAGVIMVLATDPSAANNTPPAETMLCTVRVDVFADSETEARGILSKLARHPMARKAAQKSEFRPTDIETMFVGRPGRKRSFGLERHSVDNIWTDTPKDALINIRESLLEAPSRRSRVVVVVKDHQNPLPDAAFSVKASAYIGIFMVWDNAAEDAAILAWLRKNSTTMQPFANGHYINEVDVQGNPQKIRRSFSPEAWQRLRAVRKKYDPNGVFHDFFGLANG